MTDQRLRAAERAAATGDLDARGALARARLRAGELPALVVPESKHGDHVVTWGEAPLSVVVPLRALVGCEVSRLVLDVRTEAKVRYMLGVHMSGQVPADRLVRAIARLAADLPPVRVDNVECGACAARREWTGDPLGVLGECSPCNGTCRRTHETPGDRYLLAGVAIAAARAVMGWKVEIYAPEGWLGTPALRAIEAAERWAACPCPERLTEWLSACHPLVGSNASRWVPNPQYDAEEQVEAASRLTDVRPAIREAVLSMTGGAW